MEQFKLIGLTDLAFTELSSMDINDLKELIGTLCHKSDNLEDNYVMADGEPAHKKFLILEEFVEPKLVISKNTKRIIYKYPLLVVSAQEIQVPINSFPFCVQLQRDEPCLWVDTPFEEKQMVALKIVTIGTGNQFTGTGSHDNPRLRYIGTYQRNDGTFVGHVFYELNT